MKIFFTIKTHYLSTYIQSIWADLTSGGLDYCFVLLNNEKNQYEKNKGLFHDQFYRSIIPFRGGDLRKIGLPVVPFDSESLNSWRNGDYGFYLVLSHLNKIGVSIEDNDVFFQIDNDIMLTGDSWANFSRNISQREFDVVTIEHAEKKEGWSHYAAARYAFGENCPIYMSFFGIHACRAHVVKKFYIARQHQFKELSNRLKSIGKDIERLTKEDAALYWPLCEAFVGTQAEVLNLKTLSLRNHMPGSFRNTFFTKVKDFQSASFDVGASPSFFHPVKEPLFQLYDEVSAFLPAGLCVDNEKKESHTSIKNAIRWDSSSSLFIHPNKNGSEPKTCYEFSLVNSYRRFVFEPELTTLAKADVSLQIEFIRENFVCKSMVVNVLRGQSCDIYSELIPENTDRLRMTIESASEKTAGSCHFYLKNFYFLK